MLIKLSDQSGQTIDENGRVFDSNGKFTHQLSRVEDDTEVALADYAARFYHSRLARACGHSVVMRDSDGDGVLVQMDLAQGDVHVDTLMPNFAGGYTLDQGVADLALPPLAVNKASNKFAVWDSANAFKRVIPSAASAGAQVPEVNPTLSTLSYSTVEYALAAYVPTEVDANADAPLRPLQAATRRVMNALMLEREIRVATLLTTGANWDSSLTTTLGATAKWNGGSASDPLADLHARIEASYMPVTAIVWSEQVEHDFVRNTNVQKYLYAKNAVNSVPNGAEISSALRLPRIITAKMKYQASGTTQSYVWGNDVVLLHQSPDMPPTSGEEVATGYTMRWSGGDTPDGAASNGWLVRQYFDQRRGGRGGRVVVVVHNDAEVFTSKYVGGLIKSAHQ